MARRRGFFKRARAGASRFARRAGKRVSGATPEGLALGSAGYAAIGEPLADKGLAMMNMGGNYNGLAKGIAGYLMAKKTTGFFRNVGMGALSVETYKFTKANVPSLGGLLGGNNNGSVAASSGATFA